MWLHSERNFWKARLCVKIWGRACPEPPPAPPSMVALGPSLLPWWSRRRKQTTWLRWPSETWRSSRKLRRRRKKGRTNVETFFKHKFKQEMTMMVTVKVQQTAGFIWAHPWRPHRSLSVFTWSFLPTLTLSPSFQLSLVLPLLHLPTPPPSLHLSLWRLRRFEESHQHSHAEGSRFAPVDPIQTLVESETWSIAWSMVRISVDHWQCSLSELPEWLITNILCTGRWLTLLEGGRYLNCHLLTLFLWSLLFVDQSLQCCFLKCSSKSVFWHFKIIKLEQ